MKVFISWSGERSRLVAEALRYWLPKVIQAVHPWMSTNDIEKGTQWRAGLTTELEMSSIGIICLTPENLESSWLHFEAGALSKQQQNTRVCTFLYKLDPVDVREPLAQFQYTRAQKDDIRKLVLTVNNVLGDRKLSDVEVNDVFEVWWPKLEAMLSAIPDSQGASPPRRDEREILEEILELVRFSALTSITVPERKGVFDFIPEWVSGKHLSEEAMQVVSAELGCSVDDIKRLRFRGDQVLKMVQKKLVRPMSEAPSNPDTMKGWANEDLDS